MRTLGNILWHFPFFGFVTAFFTLLLGLLLTVIVITAPIGLGLIQYSKFLIAPYSYEMVSKGDLNIKQNPIWQSFSLILTILYLPFGLILTICTICQIACLFISIIGIPVAIPLAKSLGVYLNPVNKVCVHRLVKDAVMKAKAQQEAQRYFK